MEQHDETAIQTDVVETTETVEQSDQRPVSAREQLFREMRERNKAKPEVPAEEQGEEAEPAPVEERIKLKVNGEEVEVEASKVREAGIRALQKESAADQKLERAAARERELTQMQRELEKRAGLLAQAQKQLEENPPQTKKEIEEAEQVFTMLMEGEEKAKDWFAGLIKRQRDLESMVSAAAKEVQTLKGERVAEKQLSLREAQTKFATDYADVVADERLRKLAGMESERLLKAEPHLSFAENLRRAGEYAAALLPKKAEPAPDNKGVKKTMLRPPPMATSRRAGPPAVKKKTTADKINEMRVKRGLGPLT